MQHELEMEGSMLRFGADAMSVQLFRTGERPPPTEKRTRRGPTAPTSPKNTPPLATSTPLIRDKEKDKDDLIDYVTELTRKDKEANTNPAINSSDKINAAENPKDSEPLKPDAEPTEAEKRREVWQVANELLDPPSNCLPSQEFWGCLLYTSPSPRDRG